MPATIALSRDDCATLSHDPSSGLCACQACSAGAPCRRADLDVAGLHGLESLNDTALILLTSVPRQGDGYHFAAAGFAGYLMKPVPSADLGEALAAVLDAPARGRLVTRYTLAEARVESAASVSAEPLGLRVLVAEDNRVNQKLSAACWRSRAVW
jgi:CheY-like chemotaxis protein